MPGKSGYEICRLIREQYSLLQLPILMLTVRDSQEDILKAFEVGANDYLAKPFNKREMLARVRTLLTLKRTMTEVLSSEMRFLQAQIRPHFLYNTLNTIMGFCRKDPEKARELLDQLSCYLRGKFKFGEMDKFILLKEELELVKAYLHIEKARFGDRLQVVSSFPAGANYWIPPLILQPLVENAVRHGIYPRKEGGTIVIKAEDLADALVISIKDDGVGMSKTKIEEILNTQKEIDGIGLRNVNQRLKSHYGQGLSISSEEGRGTTVMVRIPKNRERGS
ncbi:MAG: histidine kinase [Peptococcaceae bacterium]|nr:histidine kinase [Peptococcaceae bacterium]